MQMDPIDYWRISDELTVFQAALLIVGQDPASSAAHCESWQIDDRPVGYEAAKAAIKRALLNGSVKGNLQPHWEYSGGRAVEPIDGTVDIDESIVDVESLRAWLASKGVRSGFFFPERPHAPDYANPDSEFYAPALAAAVAAWEAVSSEPELLKKRTSRQAMIVWLKKNASMYGLLDDEGNPREKRIGDLATFANWDPTPGARKLPDSPHES